MNEIIYYFENTILKTIFIICPAGLVKSWNFILVLISLTVYRKTWNEVDLSSYLIEITSKILAKTDEVTGEGHFIDYASLYEYLSKVTFYFLHQYINIHLF